MRAQAVTLTPAQAAVAAEMLAHATGIGRTEDAALVIHHLETLKERGVDNATIVKWLTLLPKAQAKAGLA